MRLLTSDNGIYGIYSDSRRGWTSYDHAVVLVIIQVATTLLHGSATHL